MINIRMQHKDVKNFIPRITVVGVGGAGGNAVNNMIASGLQGAEFIVCNTDAQALDGSLCEVRLQLGELTTGGLGAGAKPETGRAAAEETLPEVMKYLEGANMAFITAGMGGGTGTGAAPVIARACREKGILTVGVVTKPFHFEGAARMRMAEAGIKEMQDYVDTLIVIPNQNLFRIANEKTTFAEAFRLADTVLQSGVRGVTDLIVRPGEVNLDFADIKSVMLEMGKAMMGTGEATGERRAVQAAEVAINNPLLDDVSMKGARAVIINITGGPDMTLFEFDEACNRIRDEVDPNANIIVGSSFDQSMDGVMRVSVIATGIDVAEEKTIRRAPPGVTVTTVGTQSVNAQLAERRNEAAIRAEAAAAHNYAIENALPRVAAQMQAQVSSHATIPQPVRVNAPAQSQTQTHAAVVEAARRAEAEGYAPSRTDEFSSSQQQQQPTPAEVTRAVVYGNSFIPPKPVEVDPPRDAVYHTSPGGLAAQRRVIEDGQVQSGAGLNLRPPVPGASFHAKKKAPSLFDRITNRHQPGDETIIDTPATPSRPGQTVLGVEPRKPEITDDELDIPAFLRRQAN